MTSIQELRQLFEELKLPAQFADDFLKKAKIITVKKNDFFVKEGDISSYIGIVKSGSLFSFFEDDNNDISVNELYSPLSLISSYRSFLTQSPSPANFKANAVTEVYVITYKEYVILQKDLDWLIFFKAFSDALFVRKCLKETTLINFSAKKRYQVLIKQRGFVEQLFPQRIIASYLKMRPETLSRLKSLDLSQRVIV
ncbi:hypothetical protein [Polaribacter staleyi]|uniref:Crp/Fnr family transcriptional regulator n=1 Tax=Polaribacter staleyi TaxID=2022337 RepID=UPI0031BBAAAC